MIESLDRLLLSLAEAPAKWEELHEDCIHMTNEDYEDCVDNSTWLLTTFLNKLEVVARKDKKAALKRVEPVVKWIIDNKERNVIMIDIDFTVWDGESCLTSFLRTCSEIPNKVRNEDE